MFHILVVDDDKNTRRYISAVLEAENYTVTAASDANGKVTFKLVPYGTYYMKETARTTANPYWDNNTIYKVEVKPKVLPNNPVAKVIISVYQSPASSERDFIVTLE